MIFCNETFVYYVSIWVILMKQMWPCIAHPSPDWHQASKYTNILAHTYISIYTTVKIFTDCLIYCISGNGKNGNGEVMKYHIFIFVVVIELSVRCLNTGPEDRPTKAKRESVKTRDHINSAACDLEGRLFPMYIASGWTAMM